MNSDEFSSSEEFQEAAQQLLKLVEEQEAGRITDMQLFYAWAKFRRKADKYLDSLRKINDSNKNFS